MAHAAWHWHFVWLAWALPLGYGLYEVRTYYTSIRFDGDFVKA